MDDMTAYRGRLRSEATEFRDMSKLCVGQAVAFAEGRSALRKIADASLEKGASIEKTIHQFSEIEAMLRKIAAGMDRLAHAPVPLCFHPVAGSA